MKLNEIYKKIEIGMQHIPGQYTDKVPSIQPIVDTLFRLSGQNKMPIGIISVKTITHDKSFELQFVCTIPPSYKSQADIRRLSYYHSSYGIEPDGVTTVKLCWLF